MENIYFLMIVALAVLAVADLIVGVSNDAVNFLNSALGSKALPVRTIMITASIGIACGALFSSGMMEVARKGIMNPGQFYFDEIMIIFMAVMITDILLLDFFNTLGMPTSTTVSIVFELLGASVAVALIKIYADGGSATELSNYINTAKATQIILGILLSVGIAFTVGAIVQYISRVLLSFEFEKLPKWVSIVFGGLAATAITYFILIKGLKGASFVDKATLEFVKNNTLQVVLYSLVFWVSVCAIIVGVLKINVYKFIILIGTFALALAFAGNDLVNFIGVPIAAWQSYEAWAASGMAASEFSMGVLASKVPTPTLLLGVAGLIMVLTLWFSKKSRHVTETEINLSRQGEAKERFQPNFLSRSIVRLANGLSVSYSTLLPNTTKQFINKRFEKPAALAISAKKAKDMPAFDMVRASVNLMVASILISIATSMKLPLSTTYVTFMVAMGTSLADRAWGNESAVYRVAGVLNVIGGWFLTAIIAFIASSTVAYLINIHVPSMVAILLLLAVLLLVRNAINYSNKLKAEKEINGLSSTESSSVQGVMDESAANIKSFLTRGNKIYSNTIDGLSRLELKKLKKSKKGIDKLNDEVEELRDNIFYFIKNLDESSLHASDFYINMLAYLQDMSQSLEYIAKISHKHVNNNHNKLRFKQLKDLKEIEENVDALFSEMASIFERKSFEELGGVLEKMPGIFDLIIKKIKKQVERTRKEESSAKNTTLYFNLLQETQDLLVAANNLIDLYYKPQE